MPVSAAEGAAEAADADADADATGRGVGGAGGAAVGAEVGLPIPPQHHFKPWRQHASPALVRSSTNLPLRIAGVGGVGVGAAVGDGVGAVVTATAPPAAPFFT